VDSAVIVGEGATATVDVFEGFGAGVVAITEEHEVIKTVILIDKTCWIIRFMKNLVDRLDAITTSCYQPMVLFLLLLYCMYIRSALYG